MSKNEPSSDVGGLSLANNALQELRRNSRLALVVPIPMLVAAYFGFGIFSAQWYKDPFIACIAVVFVVGQLFAMFQHRLFLRGSRKAKHVLEALQELKQNGIEGVLVKLRSLEPGHFRDLMLRAIKPLQVGDATLTQNLFDNAASRRSVHENRRMSQHISINRIILKLGFLGTLIGLLLTFPPMKEAMLSLNGSEGELKFVTHIATALDGDRFAIFATLIATGLSLLIELVTIQLMERSFGRFENINSLAEEWLVSEAGSLVNKNPAGWSGDFSQMQHQIYKNLNELAEMVRKTTRRIDDVRELQESLENRYARLSDLARETKA